MHPSSSRLSGLRMEAEPDPKKQLLHVVLQLLHPVVHDTLMMHTGVCCCPRCTIARAGDDPNGAPSFRNCGSHNPYSLHTYTSEKFGVLPTRLCFVPMARGPWQLGSCSQWALDLLSDLLGQSSRHRKPLQVQDFWTIHVPL